MQSKENKRYFLKPMLEHEVQGLFRILDSEKCLFHIWSKGDSGLYKLQFSHRDESKLVFKKPDEDDFSQIKILADNTLLLKITGTHDQFFTHGELNWVEEDELFEFILDKQVHKGVQRNDCRIERSSFVKVSLIIADKEYECNDVSAGGTGFTVLETDLEQFKPETKFQDCKLKFNAQKFNIPNCRVAMNKEIESENEVKSYKVGIQFLDLSYKVEDEIWLMVNKEMKRVFMLEQDRKRKKAS